MSTNLVWAYHDAIVYEPLKNGSAAFSACKVDPTKGTITCGETSTALSPDARSHTKVFTVSCTRPAFGLAFALAAFIFATALPPLEPRFLLLIMACSVNVQS